jgi:tail-anchored protein insertion receptor
LWVRLLLQRDVTDTIIQLWQIYSRTPFGSSKEFQDQLRLRRDVVRLKRELAGISAQDDFAKWAKLRRQHDKAMEEHDKKGVPTTFC